MPDSSTIHDKNYVSTAEVGKRFGYTSEYITLLAREGRIESKKIGNRWYVNLASAQNFFDAAEREREARRQTVSDVRKAEFRSYGNVRQHLSHTKPIIGMVAISIVGLLLGATGYLWNGVEQKASVIGAYGNPNLELNYQGKLTDASNMAVPDGTYNMRFWILTSPTIATTSALWTESLTDANRVTVQNGLFSIMLGSTSPLTSVDFNQTLYLGVEIGGTSTPVWDGEMSPRKVLGTVPASFEAARLGGLTPSQFVRTDATSTIATTSASTLLTVTQSGTGDILNLVDGSTEVFTVIDGGNVGVGTTSPQSKLHVSGNIALPNGGQIRFDDGVGAYIVEESNGLRFYAGNVGSVLAMEINGNGKTQVGSAWFDSDLAGNVGIGTTTPSHKLTVAGNAFVQSLTATGTVTFSGLADGILMSDSSGVLSVSTSLNSSFLDGEVLLSSEIDTSSELAALLTDETGTAGNAVFSTNPLLAGFRSSASSTIGDGTATGGLTIYGNATTTGSVYVAGSIGIGTSTPVRKLDVVTNSTSLIARFGTSDQTLGHIYFTNASSTDDKVRIGANKTDLVLSTNYLERMRIDNAGNVGIGSTSPSSLLTISNSVSTAANTPLFTIASTTGGTSTSTLMTVLANGNVGIGSTTPSQKLTVTAGVFDLTPASSEGTLGAELITNVADRDLSSDSGNWTGTNWTVGSGVVTHVAGNNALTLNNAALSSAPSAGNYYQIGFDIYSSATGSPEVSISFGGTAAIPRYGMSTGNQTSQAVVVKAVSAGALTIAPNNATWTGTIDNVSIKQITPSALAQTIRNANGTAGLEFRAGGTGLYNTFMGVDAGVANTTGAQNSFIGYQSGLSNTSGSYNVANGYRSLSSNTTGQANTAAGYESLYSNTSGNNNTANGSYALRYNTTGFYNTGIGTFALYVNTTGMQNTAVGGSALYSNTTGNFNTANGVVALQNNTSGSNNTANGYLALNANTIGTHNTANGSEALRYNISGGYNTANGGSALSSNTTGSNNTAIGINALQTNTTGNSNAVNGAYALSTNTTGSYNTAMGSFAGRFLANGSSANGTSSNSVFLGYDTRASVADGYNEIVIGASAIGNGSNSVTLGNTSITKTILQGNVGIGSTSPSYKLTVSGGDLNIDAAQAYRYNGSIIAQASTTKFNYFFGGSGNASMTGTKNVALGYESLISNTSGDNNVANGYHALYSNTTGYSNSAIGVDALYFNTTGYGNTSTGFETLRANSSGYQNTANGYQALAANTSGYQNTANGYQALRTNSSGVYNTAIGSGALYSNTTGGYNIAVGYESGHYLSDGSPNATSSGSVFLGYDSRAAVAGGTNEIVIGYTAIGNGSNSVTLGNTSITKTILQGNVGIGSTTPSAKLTVNGDVYGANLTATGTLTVSGVATLATLLGTNATITNATTTNLAATSFTLGSDYITDITGTGLTLTNGVLSASGGGSNWLVVNGALTPSTTVGLSVNASTTIGDGTATGGLTIFGNSTTTGNAFVEGFFNTNSGYKQNNITVLYASSSNFATMVGMSAGANLLSGAQYNTALGYRALYTATSSDYNTAIGYEALRLNTSGYNNTANGYYSLLSNTVGSENTGYGYQALASNTTGSFSTAIGSGALWNSSTGYGNTAVGGYALSNNTTGYQNIALGQIAGSYLSNGSSPNATSTNSVFLGYDSRAAVAGGTNEIVIGHTAIGNGSNSVTLGNTAITKTILQGNVGIGSTTPSYKLTVNGDIYSSGYVNSSSGYQQEGNTILYASSTNYSTRVGIGAGAALLSDGIYNTALGYQALLSATSSDNNTAVGYRSLYSNTTGAENTAVGYHSLYSNIGGHYNTAFGSYALYTSTASNGNTAFGSSALRLNTTGNGNVANGFYALYSNTTGSSNTASGNNALYGNTTGNYNTVNGTLALSNNVSGSFNTVIGSQALYNNISATSSTALGAYAARGAASYANQGGVYLGYYAGYSASTSSDFNTLVGYQSGYGVTTGARNVLLGNSTIVSSYNQITTGSNNISIGNDVAVPSATANNQLVIGNLIYGTGLDGTGSTISSGNIGIGTTTPSNRLTLAGGAFDLTPASSEGTLGAELITNVADRDLSSDSGNWTGTNWTVGSGKVTHTVGNNALTLNNAALSSAPSAGNYYQIGFDINTTAVGTPGVSVTFGGTTAVPRYGVKADGNQTAQVVVVKAVSAGALTIAPNNATWTGTIDNVSIKQITPSALAQTIRNANGTAGLEFRAGGAGLLNTFMGVEVGLVNTTGNKNAFLGYQAGSLNTIGDSNSFLGYRAGYANTTGGSNSFIGSEAGYANTTGYNNSFVGTGAGYTNLTGLNNTFMGYHAGYANTSGSSNVFMGSVAGYANTTGSNNAFVGLYAGYANTTGGNNAFLGMNAGYANTTGSSNAFLGMNAGYANTTGSSNAFIGSWSGYNNTTGEENSFVGYQTGYANTTGGGNSFVGYHAGYANVTGYFNVAIGRNAGRYLANGSSANGTSSNSIFLGYDTRASVADGDNEIVIGASAIGNGSNSVTLGNTSITKTILQGNVGIGSTSPSSLLTISNSVSTAANTPLFTIASTTGGTSTSTLMTVLANGNVGMGTSTPATALQVIGDIRVGVSGTDGCVQGFGGASLTGTCSSDERLKMHIADVRGVLDKFTDLRVVTYNWNETAFELYKNDMLGTQTGFLAQNVESLFPELVSTDSKGYKRVDYSTLSLYTAQAVHELSFNTLTNNRTVSLYEATEHILPGQLVALTLSPEEENEVRLASTTDEAIGVAGNLSASTIQNNGATGLTVISSGRVAVLVTDENGQVERGDSLTLSRTQPGYAMKQTENGRSIGRALMSATTSGTTSIEVNFDSAERTMLLSGIDGEALIAAALASTQENTSIAELFTERLIDGLMVVREYAAVSIKAVVGYFDKIFAKEIHTDMVCVGDVCVDEATFLKVIQSANVTPLPSGNSPTTTEDVEPPLEANEPQPGSPIGTPEPVTEPLPTTDAPTTTAEMSVDETPVEEVITPELIPAPNEETPTPETTSEPLAETIAEEVAPSPVVEEVAPAEASSEPVSTPAA